MSEPRKNFHIVFMGAQGCGKTTVIIKFIKHYFSLAQNAWKRGLIAVPDGAEEKVQGVQLIKFTDIPFFKGLKRVIAGRKQNLLGSMKKWFLPTEDEEIAGKGHLKPKFNGLLWMDDARGMVARRNEEDLDFLSRRRQANCDIISVFHGLKNEVPPSFWGFVTKIVLFETADAPEEMVKNLPANKREEFMEVYHRVQEKAKENPYYYEEFVLRKI